MVGWLKLHRKLLNWEWYNKSEYVHLFLHILIKANFEEKKWQGIEVKRGQLITSINHLSLETGISERSIRTILNKLKSTNELSIKTTNKYSLLTVEKYDDYQCDEEKTTNKTTNKTSLERQTTDKQLTTTKEVKNVNNEKNKEKALDNMYLGEEIEKVKLTNEQFNKLITKYDEQIINNSITRMDNYCVANGKTYKDYYRALLNWIDNDVKKNNGGKENGRCKLEREESTGSDSVFG